MKRVPKKKEHYVNNADFLAAIIKYKEKVEIPMNAKVALSDIDLVIQEVLNKPMVNINVA